MRKMYIEAPPIAAIEGQSSLFSPDDFFYQAEEILDPDFVLERQQIFNEAVDSSMRTLELQIESSELDHEQKAHYLSRLNEISGRFVVDMSPPPNSGGYYSVEQDYIGIPALQVLYASQESLQRVISHELNHAVLGIADEGMTDSLALEQNDGQTHGVGGYPEEVQEYQRWFGHLSTSEVIGMIHPDSSITLMNILGAMVDEHGQLDPETAQMSDLKQELKRRWKVLTEMFPRLINQVMGHQTIEMQVVDGDFESFWQYHQQEFCMRFWGSPERMKGLEA